MKRYRVNEIFYSLQGEGARTGIPSVFVRFAGCNLRCPFCDTDHSDVTEMTSVQIADEVKSYRCPNVVLTGGEPSLQVDTELVGALHANGLYIQIETNGTLPVPPGIDWVTCSPKGAPLALHQADELKLVYGAPGIDPADYDGFTAAYRSLQPCDTGDAARNVDIISPAVRYCLDHPQWRLSLQTHKLLDIK